MGPSDHERRLSIHHSKPAAAMISKARILHDISELVFSVEAIGTVLTSGEFFGTAEALSNDEGAAPLGGTLAITCAGLIPYDSHDSICICLASPEISIWIKSVLSGSSRYLASSFGSTSAIRGSAWLTASTPSLLDGVSAILPTLGEMLPSATH